MNVLVGCWEEERRKGGLTHLKKKKRNGANEGLLLRCYYIYSQYN